MTLAGKVSQQAASSRSLLDNLIQKNPPPMRREVLLDQLLTNIEEVTGEVHTPGSLSCSNHALVKIMI